MYNEYNRCRHGSVPSPQGLLLPWMCYLWHHKGSSLLLGQLVSVAEAIQFLYILSSIQFGERLRPG
jgi:hypothetical protein